MDDQPPQYTPTQVQQFDHIDEPPPPRPVRFMRKFNRPSPLSAYQAREFPPPPLNQSSKKGWKYYLWPALWIAWLISMGIWLGFAVYHLSVLHPGSRLNPLRHKAASYTFSLLAIAMPAATMVAAFYMDARTRQRERRRQIWKASYITVIVGVLEYSVAIGFLAYLYIGRPYLCEKSGKFPVHVTFKSGDLWDTGPYAKVFVHNKAIWKVRHEVVDGGYHAYISHRYLVRDFVKKEYVQQDTKWPYGTAVTSIWTSFHNASDADGTITGECRGRFCLQGKFWTAPNLVFEWNYTDPFTATKKATRLASDEGKWYFGKTHRPLVSLWRNGTEVFRAQSTETVCGAGDGDLETCLVPVGLMFIAETRYNNWN